MRVADGDDEPLSQERKELEVAVRRDAVSVGIWHNLAVAQPGLIEPALAIPYKPDCGEGAVFNWETGRCQGLGKPVGEPVAGGPYRAAKGVWWGARWIGRVAGIFRSQPGSWARAAESMSVRSAAYQQQITGRLGEAYEPSRV